MTPEARKHLHADHEQREQQIKDALRVEWRLKTESGIHHDHLSDLAFLIAALEHERSVSARLRATQTVTEKPEPGWQPIDTAPKDGAGATIAPAPDHATRTCGATLTTKVEIVTLNHRTRERGEMNRPEPTREQNIQGLRELADFLTAYPSIPVSKHTINEFPDSDEVVDLQGKTLGTFTTIETEEFTVLRKQFAGGIVLDVNIERPTKTDDETPDPSTHTFVASVDFSDCCKVCGENESAHQ